MSRSEGDKTVAKRFFVQGTEDLHKRLQHLAIDFGTSAEKLAGRLLEEAVARAERDAAPDKPKARR